MNFIKKVSLACAIVCFASASWADTTCQSAPQATWGDSGYTSVCPGGTLTYTIPGPGGSGPCKNGCNSHYPWVVKLVSASPGIAVNIQINNSPPIVDHNAHPITPSPCTSGGTSMTCTISQHGIEGGSGGTVVFTNSSQNSVQMSVQ